ncbi:AAA family ATPase [Marinicellulosiphila megalodicopiae]|uniref:AAA family ATPase n=1 Tax=Marinicellulosiphila megalodicopiae TaxID=2724896 RepID=UPI003BB0F4DB
MEYLDYYGLEFNPFELPVDAMFSTAGGRGHLLEKIEHLVAFSEFNVFIYGQQGIGKTNFLKNLVCVPSSMWKSVYLPVTNETKLDDILKSVLLEYELTLSKNASLEVFAAEVCENLQSEGCSILLLCIDDAHLLNSEIFEQFIKLKMNFEKFEIQLKVLFAGEQSLLEANCEYAEDTDQSYHLFLKSLSIEETKSYLTLYFQKAGRSEKIPLSSFDIKRIYEMSQGIPAKINLLTPEYLIQSLDQPVNRSQLPIIIVSAGVFGLILLISAFYFNQQNQLEDQSSSQTTQLELISQPTSDEVLAKANSVLEKLQQASEHQLLLEEQKEEVVQQNPEIIKNEMENIKEINPELESKITQLNEVDELDIIINEPGAGLQVENKIAKLPVEEVLDIAQPLIKLSQSDPQIVEKTDQENENDWFYVNSGWTVQVIGSYNEQSIVDFINDYKQFEWHKYRRVLNNKDYYVAVLGLFETKQQAQQALSQAPKIIRDMDTWTRTIDSIRPLLDP